MASFQKYETKQGSMWMFKTGLGVDPSTGKRLTTTRRGFKTKKEAQIAASKLDEEVRTGSYVKEQEILFKDFVDVWLKIYSQSGVKLSSVISRQKSLNRLIISLGSMKMKDITHLTYQATLDELATNGYSTKKNNGQMQGYSSSAMSSMHACSKMLFRKALELKVIKNDPTEFVKLPKKVKTVEDIESEEKKLKFLEKEELAHFLNVTKENGLAGDLVIFSLLAYSGLRSGELLGLKWSDINFTDNTISITKTLFYPGNNREYILQTPKTNGSIRIIKMDSNVMKMLKQHKVKQIELQLYLGQSYNNQNFVFTRSSGIPMYAYFIENRMKRLLKLSSIQKDITPHSMRHTHISLLIEAGVGVKEIQQRLGHTDINTTMNIYAHMTKNMEEKASQQFSELMKGLVNF